MSPWWILGAVALFLVASWWKDRLRIRRRRSPLREHSDFHRVTGEGLRGGLSQMPLSEVFQYLAVCGASGFLHVTSGRRVGRVDFSRGRILAARFRRQEGMDALLAMLSLNEGDFQFEKTVHTAHVQQGWDALDVIMIWMDARPEGVAA